MYRRARTLPVSPRRIAEAGELRAELGVPKPGVPTLPSKAGARRASARHDRGQRPVAQRLEVRAEPSPARSPGRARDPFRRRQSASAGNWQPRPRPRARRRRSRGRSRAAPPPSPGSPGASASSGERDAAAGVFRFASTPRARSIMGTAASSWPRRTIVRARPRSEIATFRVGEAQHLLEGGTRSARSSGRARGRSPIS